MPNIKIDFNTSNGIVKPMHAVNNGPAGSRIRNGNSTFQYFKEAGIPYARNHDASFCQYYGGEYTVDVHRIFTDFNADPEDPRNYDFEMTDMCVADTLSVGTKVFYRLGASIEHGKKKGTFPPADFKKWAIICEHIIRHYNEGFADGFNYGIEYWEIWNEPDCYNADGSNPCWQGTEEQFAEFFATAFCHLKEKFPHLKLGGPAFSSIRSNPKKDRFIDLVFTELNKRGAKLDFFSFHRYTNEPAAFRPIIDRAKEIVETYGHNNAELILNEWNYIRGWRGDDWTYSMRSEKGLKGASFTTGCMCVGQQSPLDMLMYYDARPCAMNGMFDTDFLTPLKGYYPFKMFNEHYKMGESVTPEYQENPLYCTAAKDDTKMGIMLTNFDENDQAPTQNVTLSLTGLRKGAKIEKYILDETYDCELTETIDVTDEKMDITFDLPLFTVAQFIIK